MTHILSSSVDKKTNILGFIQTGHIWFAESEPEFSLNTPKWTLSHTNSSFEVVSVH